MATRYIRAAIGAVGAGANSGAVTVPTFDDSRPRTVTGFRTSNATKGVHTKLDVAGTIYADLDHGVVNGLTQMIELAEPIPVNVLVSFNVFNDSGAALAAGDFIEIRYTV